MITLAIVFGLYNPADTVMKETTIDEVVVSSFANPGSQAVRKGRLASIDEHIRALNKVDVVRRGSYAWEPVVNGMQTERLSTTIDGMKIFYACTDRMDPVTSYVESGNLQRISLDGGLDGNPQATGNIGGSIDLKLRKVGFSAQPSEYNLSAGYESNGNLFVTGADAAFSSSRFYSNFGAYYRGAGNYRAGGEEVEYSQFHKFNAFVNVGFQPRLDHIIEGTVIFDRAFDVGYPALTMDVKDATGFITSLSFRRENIGSILNRWETKAYYNHILHNMDDTTRPDIVIHMDMPGRSKTAGLYSLFEGTLGGNRYQLNYDVYYNTLFADMTMYVSGAKPMYMLTWPDVHTFNTGFSFTDDLALGEHHNLRLSAKLSWQHRHICNDEGFKALAIYFPQASSSDSQLSGRIAASYAYEIRGWRFTLGTGYGSRTPTITEAYGYFLNNTFDLYDYIGNPHLRNEKAAEANLSVEWKGRTVEVKAETDAFFFSDYIIGLPDSRLSAMTIGAAGVKVYQNLRSACIVNSTLSLVLHPIASLSVDNRLVYSYGKENTGSRLPLIAPLTYNGNVRYSYKSLTAGLGVRMAARNSNYSEKYGETSTPGYAVWNVDFDYRLSLGRVLVDLRLGAENIFNRYYSTYSDWNHIPQKGRNVYFNTVFRF